MNWKPIVLITIAVTLFNPFAIYAEEAATPKIRCLVITEEANLQEAWENDKLVYEHRAIVQLDELEGAIALLEQKRGETHVGLVQQYANEKEVLSGRLNQLHQQAIDGTGTMRTDWEELETSLSRLLLDVKMALHNADFHEQYKVDPIR